MKNGALLITALLITYFSALSQSITVEADNYRHVFEGAGTSIGLYIGHHFSMNESDQDKAIQLINKDCNMQYLQDYVGKYPTEKPKPFDNIANYVLAARNCNPGNSLSIVVNNFPDNLRTDVVVDGKAKRLLDAERPGIYDELANWYFEVLKGLKERGVDVDILNMVNEPDFKKKYNYGFGDPKKGVSFILKEAVPRLKAMINDPTINTAGVKIPLIMAPSTLAPDGCLNYVNYFKENYPEAWEQVDIVATHQYNKGFVGSKFDQIVAAIDGKPFFQSEMHAGRGDGLGDLPIEKPHENCLSFARVFGASVNAGVNSWFYFQNNYPQSYHPGGLIHVPWKGAPDPYKHYYAFRQLTSTQPFNSHLIERSVNGLETNGVMTFRKIEEDTIYLNVSNFEDVSKNVTINVNGTGNKIYGIKAVKVWSTDAELNGELIVEASYAKPLNAYAIDLEPYSVNTIKITIDPDGPEQSITSIDRMKLADDLLISNYSGLLTIEHRRPGSIASVQMLSLQGIEVFKEEFLNVQRYEFSISDLSDGIYLVRISDTDGRIASKKILKL